MTSRARAQLAAVVDVADCVEAVTGRDLDFARHSAAEFAKASVSTPDDDRAVIAIGAEGDRIGLRKIGGDWVVDNIVNALDEERGEADSRLSKGSVVQQVRATVNAHSDALARRDHERACALFSHRATAQIVIGLAFNLRSMDGDLPERVTCASALGRLVTLTDEEDPFGQGQPLARIDAAQVSVRGDRAAVEIDGFESKRLVRQDGRWVVDGGLASFSLQEHRPASALKRCWRRSGATIASEAGELRFAAGSRVRDASDNFDHVSVKGNGWRIFYARPADGPRILYALRAIGEDPGLEQVLAKPDSVPAVAYVKNAPAHADVVAKARRCGE